MALYKSNVTKYPSLNPSVTTSEAGKLHGSFGVAEIDTSIDANDIVLLCNLPANHEPFDFILSTDSLDDGTAITVSVGIVNADQDDLVASTKFIDSDTVAQAGGTVRASVVGEGLALAPSDSDRYVGLKVETAAGTAAAGKVYGKLIYCQNPS